jgi:hypothetical protein
VEEPTRRRRELQGRRNQQEITRRLSTPTATITRNNLIDSSQHRRSHNPKLINITQ